jgi:hypothetical protein
VEFVKKTQLFLIITINFALLFFFADEILAQRKVPRFKDYPVAKTYWGKIPKLKLTSDDEPWRDRFQWAIENQKVNFAGHYIVTDWSCGSTCVLGAAINAQTGKISWWKVRLNYDVEAPVSYRRNSRLIILSGCRGDDADYKTGTHFFKIQNGKFVHLKSVASKKRPKPDCS